MNDDAKRGDLGVLALLASGPMLAGRIGEAEHTVCADCSQHEPTRTLLGTGFVNCRYANAVFHKDDLGKDPPWPGCRGFKLLPGAPGPMKRYAQAVRDRTNAALQKEKKP
jgi:hypothetical protein